MKYTKKLVKQICDELSTGKHTIADTCKKVGISETQFYVWKKNKPEFAEALKAIEEQRILAFKDMAVSGLAKLLDVFEYEEVHTDYVDDKEGKPKIKSQKRVKKFTMPNPAAVIFTLTNRDPTNWQNRQNVDHTSNGKGFLDYLKDSSVDPETEDE